VPRGTDGRVLTEAFEPGFVSTHPLTETEPVPVEAGAPESSGNDEVERRLKALGYI